jgi:hypothetical protein
MLRSIYSKDVRWSSHRNFLCARSSKQKEHDLKQKTKIKAQKREETNSLNSDKKAHARIGVEDIYIWGANRRSSLLFALLPWLSRVNYRALPCQYSCRRNGDSRGVELSCALAVKSRVSTGALPPSVLVAAFPESVQLVPTHPPTHPHPTDG